MTQRAKRRQSTKSLLIEHAARGLAETGTILGLGSFMASAGFTHGGFYKHFDSKEDLNTLAAECVLRGCISRTQSILSENPNPTTLALAIRIIIDSLVCTENYTRSLLTPFGSRERSLADLLLYDAYASAVDLLMSSLEACSECESFSSPEKGFPSTKVFR